MIHYLLEIGSMLSVISDFQSLMSIHIITSCYLQGIVTLKDTVLHSCLQCDRVSKAFALQS